MLRIYRRGKAAWPGSPSTLQHLSVRFAKCTPKGRWEGMRVQELTQPGPRAASISHARPLLRSSRGARVNMFFAVESEQAKDRRKEFRIYKGKETLAKGHS